MTEMAAFQQTQLLFNLSVPPQPLNLASRFHNPEPIVIEKFGMSPGPIITAPRPTNPLQLSALSESSLQDAVALARRDLKKQREEESFQSVTSTRGRGRGRGQQAKIKVNSTRQRGEIGGKAKDQQRQKVLLVKERQRGTKARTATTQTRRAPERPPWNPGGPDRAGQRAQGGSRAEQRPARSHSPPTRDPGPSSPSTSGPTSGDARATAEIQRLRQEIDRGLNTVQEAVDRACRDPPAAVPVYAEDVELARRRGLRAEQLSTRSARTVYMLTQQARVLQDDVNKLRGQTESGEKKTVLLSRLVSSHRGASRVLQTFVQHLSDYTLTTGLPRSYHDLGLLLRQLSLCCAQLEVAGETGVPQSVLNLLQHYEDMNKALEHNFPSPPPSPPRLCKQLPRDNKHSPAHKKLDFDTRPTKRPEVRGQRPGQRVEVKKKPRPAFTIDKLPPPQREPTPDRQAALRAGIAALVRAADTSPGPTPRQGPQPPVPPLDLPTTPRTPGTPKGVAWEYPLEKPRLQQWKRTGGKGLLLPQGLQRRPRLQKARPLPPSEAHYAESTRASRLKEVDPGTRLVLHSPPRSPRRAESPRRSARSPHPHSLPGSPRSTGTLTPRQQSPRRPTSPWRPPSSCSSPRQPALSPRRPQGSPPGRRDLLREVQRDRERAIHDAERQRIHKLTHELGQSEEWLEAAEDKIREKLQPLIDEAQVSVNADLLTDSLLLDLLEDTAGVLDDSAMDAETERRAGAMVDAPSVEAMLQTLHTFESEQQEIRRRWATLVYEDDGSLSARRQVYFDAPLSEQPSSPTPIHLTSQLPPAHRSLLPDATLNRLESHHTSDAAAIMFTKPCAPAPQSSLTLTTGLGGGMSLQQPISTGGMTLHQPITTGGMTLQPIRTDGAKSGLISVALTREIIESVHSHREEFERHLKEKSHLGVGKFDPWTILEQVSDEIVEECLRDVSKELDEINNDIVTQVYTTEFRKGDSPEGATVVSRRAPDDSLLTPDTRGSQPLTRGQHHQDESYSVKPRESDRGSVHHSENSQKYDRGSADHSQNSDRGSADHSENSQKSERGGVVQSQRNSQALPESARSPSPTSVAYSYEDDFVDSSPRGRTAEDRTARSDHVSSDQDSWISDDSK